MLSGVKLYTRRRLALVSVKSIEHFLVCFTGLVVNGQHQGFHLHPNSGGFRHLAGENIMWQIETFSWGEKFNMFTSISCLFLHWRGPASIPKLDGGMAGFSPTLNLPLHPNGLFYVHKTVPNVQISWRKSLLAVSYYLPRLAKIKI